MVGSGLTLEKTGLLIPPPTTPGPEPITPTPPKDVGRLPVFVTERGFVPWRESPPMLLPPPMREAPVRELREVRPSPGVVLPSCEVRLRPVVSIWVKLESIMPKGLLLRALLPKGLTIGLERSMAGTVVVMACPVNEPPKPPEPLMTKEEGMPVTPLPPLPRPRDVMTSLVFSDVTPEEVEDNPVAERRQCRRISPSAGGCPSIFRT